MYLCPTHPYLFGYNKNIAKCFNNQMSSTKKQF